MTSGGDKVICPPPYLSTTASIAMSKNKQSLVNSPWADWTTQVNNAKSFWSQNLSFNIVAQDPSDYEDTNDYDDVFYNRGQRKLSEYGTESAKASDMLSKKLKECKTICEEFATLYEFILIRTEKQNDFMVDGNDFHHGYGDFAPEYDYEIPTLTKFLQHKEV